MKKLDEKNCMILNILQENCRTSLTEISARVSLSIDSVKKRINKLINEKVFYPKIQLRPRNFGFKNIVEVKIKLHNYTEEDIKKFVGFLQKDPHVAEIIAISGQWDFTIVMIAKDALDIGKVSASIRKNFNSIINEWSESLTTATYKFEEYDMLKLIGHKQGKGNKIKWQTQVNLKKH